MSDDTDDDLLELHRKSIRKTRKVRIVETGEVFKSAIAVAEYLGCSPTTVSLVLNGRQKTTSGVHLEYTGEWTK